MPYVVVDHDQAEWALDLEGAMASLTANTGYGRFCGTGEVPPKCNGAVCSFYENLFAVGEIGRLRSKVKRRVDDATILVQSTITGIRPWRTARDLGRESAIESGSYAVHRPLVTVIPSGNDLLMRGECSTAAASHGAFRSTSFHLDIWQGSGNSRSLRRSNSLWQRISANQPSNGSRQTRSRPSRASRFGTGQ